jgi:hypothetical protein
VSRRGIPESCLSNKLNRLTLATFDDEGKQRQHTIVVVSVDVVVVVAAAAVTRYLILS